jgi:hypothetical protein
MNAIKSAMKHGSVPDTSGYSPPPPSTPPNVITTTAMATKNQSSTATSTKTSSSGQSSLVAGLKRSVVGEVTADITGKARCTDSR